MEKRREGRSEERVAAASIARPRREEIFETFERFQTSHSELASEILRASRRIALYVKLRGFGCIEK